MVAITAASKQRKLTVSSNTGKNSGRLSSIILYGSLIALYVPVLIYVWSNPKASVAAAVEGIPFIDQLEKEEFPRHHTVAKQDPESSSLASSASASDHASDHTINDITKRRYIDDLKQLNRTKILGHIHSRNAKIGIKWYNRLTALGYNEHTLVATDNVTSTLFQSQYPQYRLEVSHRIPLHYKFKSLHPDKLFRKEIESMLAHQWVDVLKHLNDGHHVLLSNVENIFSNHVPFSTFEQSDYDIFHPLDAKSPTSVYELNGFVLSSGLGWFRATPPTIQFIKTLTEQCGRLCNDQRVLNAVVTIDMNMEWNMTHWHKTFRSVNTQYPPLDDLPTLGFPGVSKKTGHVAMVWDRDFVYRGDMTPEKCPDNNWVVMPFHYTNTTTSKVLHDNFQFFDQWDSHCTSYYSVLASFE